MKEINRDPLYIVMVDDDEEDVYSMRRAFAMLEEPPRFEGVSSGAALFDLLDGVSSSNREETAYPDLILLDLNLPNMSGHDVLKRLRSDPNPYLIPVIVLSTSDSESDCVRSYREGANVFFTKPASFGGTKLIAEAITTFWGTQNLKSVDGLVLPFG